MEHLEKTTDTIDERQKILELIRLSDNREAYEKLEKECESLENMKYEANVKLINMLILIKRNQIKADNAEKNNSELTTTL
mmetsp:Transcript_42578/g.40836  ORF Transcript_42578/g.40836 Transcript_42578/m.40836 type:complete len:80 (+) Transcript_42578:875-1114(+)